MRLRFPWMGDDAVSFWARVAMPGAGKDYGMVWIPQVDDEVLVAFEHGDPVAPVRHRRRCGTAPTRAPLGDSLFDAGKVKRAGSSRAAATSSCSSTIRASPAIALISSNNKFRISLNETKGQLHVYFDGKLLLEGTGDVEVKTQGDFKVDAAGVEIKASGQTAIKGATVALN